MIKGKEPILDEWEVSCFSNRKLCVFFFNVALVVCLFVYLFVCHLLCKVHSLFATICSLPWCGYVCLSVCLFAEFCFVYFLAIVCYSLKSIYNLFAT